MPTPAQVAALRHLIGDQIRTARRQAGLTQERLAELAGVDRQAVNRIEQGHSSPKLDNLIRLALALDMQLADLVRWPADERG